MHTHSYSGNDYLRTPDKLSGADAFNQEVEITSVDFPAIPSDGSPYYTATVVAVMTGFDGSARDDAYEATLADFGELWAPQVIDQS